MAYRALISLVLHFGGSMFWMGAVMIAIGLVIGKLHPFRSVEGMRVLAKGRSVWIASCRLVELGVLIFIAYLFIRSFS